MSLAGWDRERGAPIWGCPRGYLCRSGIDDVPWRKPLYVLAWGVALFSLKMCTQHCWLLRVQQLHLKYSLKSTIYGPKKWSRSFLLALRGWGGNEFCSSHKLPAFLFTAFVEFCKETLLSSHLSAETYFGFTCSVEAIITLATSFFLPRDLLTFHIRCCLRLHFPFPCEFIQFLFFYYYYTSFIILFHSHYFSGIGRGSRDKHMFNLPCLTGRRWGFAFRPDFNAVGFVQRNSRFRKEKNILISPSALASDSKHNPIRWHVSVLILTFTREYD